jgi:hypothetical protein
MNAPQEGRFHSVTIKQLPEDIGARTPPRLMKMGMLRVPASDPVLAVPATGTEYTAPR